MRITRGQPVKAGRERTTGSSLRRTRHPSKAAGILYEYIRGKIPRERLMGKAFKNARHAMRSEYFVHQHNEERSAATRFYPHPKLGVLMGHDRL